MGKVRHYTLHWQSETRTGRITLLLDDGHTQVLEPQSAAEFAALCALLQCAPLYLHKDGTLSTSWETDFED